jgi:uroporphyrin-III C-methyltransferase / precorrin-2 dehydrogenase / sirohydrochlorin ferrochelatase
VVRLKSGDPLIFGRAGEEIEALRRSNIAYEIVPGVTSALGAAAAAGIPLTHRQTSSTLVLTAGHRASENTDADWRSFAGPESTLVIYMPGHDYADMAGRLSTPDSPKKLLAQSFRAQQLHSSKYTEPQSRICIERRGSHLQPAGRW